MKIGIEVQIDVKKIEKARLFVGKKGTYLTMTTFIDTDNVDQYDNNGFIAHKKTKEESEQKLNTPILGNCKVFYNDSQSQQQQAPQQQQRAPQGQPMNYEQGQTQGPQQVPHQHQQMLQEQQQGMDDSFDDDIPF